MNSAPAVVRLGRSLCETQPRLPGQRPGWRQFGCRVPLKHPLTGGQGLAFDLRRARWDSNPLTRAAPAGAAGSARCARCGFEPHARGSGPHSLRSWPSTENRRQLEVVTSLPSPQKDRLYPRLCITLDATSLGGRGGPGSSNSYPIPYSRLGRLTSEIAVINRAAIALATDSAVTIEESKETKVYNSVNKLFTLSKYHPVGIMIYGNATFMGIPWETIIKVYRQQLGKKKFAKLADYVTDFFQYIVTNVPAITPAVQAAYLDYRLMALFELLKPEIDAKYQPWLRGLGREPTDAEKQAAVEGIIDKIRVAIFASTKFVDGFDAAFLDQFHAAHAGRVDAALAKHFAGVPLNDNGRNQLRSMVDAMVAKNWFGPWYSGLVFAGFGDTEIMPVLQGFAVDSMLDGKLKRLQRDDRNMETGSPDVFTFAQNSNSLMFLHGIDPNLRKVIGGVMEGIVAEVPAQLLALVPGLSQADREAALAKMNELAPELLARISKKIDRYQLDQHVKPMTRVLQSLPKEEMAEMAEALVHISSMKRRFSMGVESVGGPIDVAVISKGDGFIWIKRKHYFDQSLNPHFKENYFLNGTGSVP
jgi:hypothetical protein